MIKSRARELFKPMAHQAISLKHDKTTPVVFDASDPGTGKTAVRIWAFSERRRKRGGCALVLAGRTLLKSVWADDFKKFAPDMKVSIARAENRAEAFEADADAYITNWDAATWLAKQKPSFFKKFSELIIDESTVYKHHTSQRSKAVAKIRGYFKRRSCLTGTPNSRSITDIWHQAYILDDGKRLGPSFYAFRNTVCIPRQVGRSRDAIQWEDKPGAEEAVFGLLQDIVVRHRRNECTDIPDNELRTISFELSSKQRAAYRMMERDRLLPLLGDPIAVIRRNLREGPPPALTAVNAAAVVTKLLQIASGSVYDTGTGEPQFVDSSRYELVLDLVEERPHSVVFFYWRHQLTFLQQEADKRKIKYTVIDGTSTDRERDAAVLGFQAGHYRVLFAHPQSAAHGITLTRGTATIWPGPTYNLEWFTQGNQRIHRIGQKQKTETLMILAEDTIESKVYDILTAKNTRMASLLDLFATMTKEAA